MTEERLQPQPRLVPSFRPRQQKKRAPCQDNCPNGGDIRGWIGIVAQRNKSGLGLENACTHAWRTITEVNPFPAVLGRICPHPCESRCNRSAYDGALAINALERFLGDFAIEKALPLERIGEPQASPSIGVVGSGPSGLSFAYQMARRGYPVTVYEERAEPGGMLRYGVPDYRLPRRILHAEIGRIVDLGVTLQVNTHIGRDVSLDDLRRRHAAVYLGLGAQRGLMLGIPGEAGPSVFAGVGYLEQVSLCEPVELGPRVVVVGGGNTAIDAARTARRAGAAVTVLYRRSREDMPAAVDEIEDALAEGIKLRTHCAPASVLRAEDGALTAIACVRMHEGEPDESGRRRPLVVAGSEFTLPADALIAAISQAPLLDGLPGLRLSGTWLATDEEGYVGEDMLAGGDTLGLGIAGDAIVQGRHAAERLHDRLMQPPDSTSAAPAAPVIGSEYILLESKAKQPRARVVQLPVADRLTAAKPEVTATISEAAFLAEVDRCYSCGNCFGCEHCAMYCTKGSFLRLAEPGPGMYFSLALDACEECGKCIAVCPSGYLETILPSG